MNSGIVYLVGAGPGDPGLLTLRGAELLVTADAVVYDALANPALLALASVGERDAQVELHEVGKRAGARESTSQDQINALLVELARQGKRVVRLKGGDPFVFGRGGEEALALAAADIPFEVVPGVMAGVAAPAYAGIPVTHRGVATSVTFVTGSEDPSKGAATVDWSALARAGGTLVLYMGVKALPAIVAALIRGGRDADTPAAAVQWGTYPRQRTVRATLATLHEALEREQLVPPVITVIGEVVSLRDDIAWFDRRPLFGKRILVTRARAQAGALSGRLARAGADVIEMPAIRIEPLDPEPLRRALRELSHYGWVIFTSQNAVDIFWRELRMVGGDARAFAGVKLAAVGPATGDALRNHGLELDAAPKRFVAEELLKELWGRRDVRGARVLYAAAEGARDVLPDGLATLGATVDRLAIYRAVSDVADAAPVRDKLERGDLDIVTFASASAVRSFVEAVGVDAARRAAIASIGPITSEAVRAAGLEVAIEADESTIAGLVDAIVESMREESPSGRR